VSGIGRGRSQNFHHHIRVCTDQSTHRSSSVQIRQKTIYLGGVRSLVCRPPAARQQTNMTWYCENKIKLVTKKHQTEIRLTILKIIFYYINDVHSGHHLTQFLMCGHQPIDLQDFDQLDELRRNGELHLRFECSITGEKRRDH